MKFKMVKFKARNARNSRAIAKFCNTGIDYFGFRLIVHVLIRGSLDILVTNTGIQPQVCAHLARRFGLHFYSNLAALIIEVTKYHGTIAAGIAGLHTGGDAIIIDTVDAECTALHGPLAPGRIGFLVVQVFMYERTRLVGAGHDTVTAADAGMLVDQD